MFTRNNFITLMLSLVVLTVFALALAACNTNGNGQTTGPESESKTEQTTSACLHENVEWTVTKSATCSEAGEKTSVCLDCNATLEVAEIARTAHTEIIIEGKDATCTAEGLTAGKKCSVCDTVLVEQQPVSKLAHKEVAVDGKAPTCTEAGCTSSKKCSVCGTVTLAAEVIPSTDHTESDWIIDKVAEVGIAGAKHTECTLCGKTMQSAEIPAITESHTHEGATWTVAVAPSCTAAGRKDFLCECGAVMESETIDPIPHTEEIFYGYASTCTDAGLTDGKKCSVCGFVTVERTPTAKKSHSPEVVPGVAPTCTEYGSTDGERCSVCKTPLTSQNPIAPTGHSFDENTDTCKNCNEKAAYGIRVVDGLGNPVDDIVVKLFRGDELVKMYAYKGGFLALDIEAGSYHFELDLSKLQKSYVYDQATCMITPDAPYATVRLFENAAAGESLYVSYPIDSDYDSYTVDEGSYKVELCPNDYAFFVFYPEKAAVYTVTYECDSELKISYHGGTFYVQGNDLSEYSDGFSKYENGMAFSVYSSNLGAGYVLAVYSNSATSCILNIEGVGDPGTRVEDEPWTPYLEDENTVAKQLAADKNGTYTAIDLTDLTVKAVYNETDGYYHLNSKDGPVIFIDLCSDSKYVASIQTICSLQRMGSYVYDATGALAEKRSYNELFIQYGMPSEQGVKVDEPIRIPLTKKLAEAVQSFGENNAWWAENSNANIFTPVLLGQPYNQEYAWLLYCGYYS